MPVEIRRNARDVEPVGADGASLGRVGQPPVDAAIMSEREVIDRGGAVSRIGQMLWVQQDVLGQSPGSSPRISPFSSGRSR